MDVFRLYDFPKTSKADWKNAVLKELKNDAYEQVELEIDGLTFDPYYTDEECLKYSGSFPRFWDKMRAGEEFNLLNKGDSSHFLSSISQNMLSPLLRFDTKQLPALNTLLNNQPGLFPILAPVSLASAIESAKIVKNSLPTEQYLAIRPHNQSDIPGLLETSLDLNQNIHNAAPEWLHCLDINQAQTGGVFVHIKLSGNLSKDTVKARAYKSLWYNWLEYKKASSDVPIFINAHWDISEPFPDHIIRQTVNMIIAANCQSDRVSIHTTHLDKVQSRTVRHIFNVASIESHIGLHPDPLAGSYFLNFASSSLAKSVWDEYHLLKNK